MSRAGPRLAAANQRAFADQRRARDARAARDRRSRRRFPAPESADKPGVEHRRQQLGEVDARARVALRDDVRAKQHHRAHFALGQQIADARRVAPNEIDLQLGEPIRRDRDVGQLAEAGRHAVRDRAAARRARRRRRGSRPARCRACGASETGARSRATARDLFQRERIPVDDDFIVSWPGMSASHSAQFKGARCSRQPRHRHETSTSDRAARDNSALPGAL